MSWDWMSVVCGEHGIRYPAAWHGCRVCSVSNQSLVNGDVHDTTRVEVA